MPEGERFCMQRKIVFLCVGIGVLMPMDMLYAIATLPLQNYALPDNAIREKLTALFHAQSSVSVCTHDKTWVDFGSWHWLIGQLATNDNTPFVIKAAKYPAYETIKTPQYPGLMQIHGAQQNLSRISRSQHAQKIIADKQLTAMRIPPLWAYPLSGNNSDLNARTITDQQVMIIEEMVKKKSDDKVWCSYVSDKVQSDVLHINKDMFQQLVTFAQNGKFLDLTPKNLLVDAEGKLVVIDLEDTFAYQRRELNTTHFLLRPLKRFKLRCKEEGAAMYGVGITGLSHADDASIRRHGQQLINRARCTLLIKRNIVEIIAIAIAFVGVAFLIMRHMYSAHATNVYIKKCRAHLQQLLAVQPVSAPLTALQYQLIAQRAVKSIRPDEYRDTIFDAFATIAFAETMHDNQALTIFGREYRSPYQAIRKSIHRISTIWRADRLSNQHNNEVKMMADKKSVGVTMAW